MTFGPALVRRGYEVGGARARARRLRCTIALGFVAITCVCLAIDPNNERGDHWREPGSPCTIAPGAPHHFVIWSAGPDHVHGTADDIRCDR